jgi:hypothetical protein
MLFGIIGGIIFIVGLEINEWIFRKDEVHKATNDGYEVCFTK